ncbi:MAG: hypothetical protein NVSMB48_14330 [Marmoricola sp.]
MGEAGKGQTQGGPGREGGRQDAADRTRAQTERGRCGLEDGEREGGLRREAAVEGQLGQRLPVAEKVGCRDGDDAQCGESQGDGEDRAAAGVPSLGAGSGDARRADQELARDPADDADDDGTHAQPQREVGGPGEGIDRAGAEDSGSDRGRDERGGQCGEQRIGSDPDADPDEEDLEGEGGSGQGDVVHRSQTRARSRGQQDPPLAFVQSEPMRELAG